MRKALVLAVALGALVAVPAASAGSLSGVVVAKDAKRKALVVVSGRSVRTVRAGARFTRVRVGQRVAATVRKRADGTYTPARCAPPAGRSRSASERSSSSTNAPSGG